MSTLVLAGKLAGTAAIVAGAFVTGHALSSAPAAGAGFASTAATGAVAVSTSGSASGSGSTCVTPGTVDKDLRAARKKALAEPKGEQRRAAVKQVAEDARAGKYGAAAKSAALASKERRTALRKAAPDSFRTALKAARAEPKGRQRHDAVKRVEQDAAKGTYGDTFAKAVNQAKDHREACRAERKKAQQARRTAACQARAEGKPAKGKHGGTSQEGTAKHPAKAKSSASPVPSSGAAPTA